MGDAANTELMNQMMMLFLGGMTVVVIIVASVIALVGAAVRDLRRRAITDPQI